jgi:SAM-dependent methyltransferase
MVATCADKNTQNEAAVNDQDRQRWNRKFLQGEHDSTQPSCIIAGIEHFLPRQGKSLDVAGGAGRHSLWLAQHGLTVTLVDISDEALRISQTRAKSLGIQLQTVHLDLEQEPFPPGPWDLILGVHYLDRTLFPRFTEALAPGGLLVFLQPTQSNLQRHQRPSARFLLEDGELPTLLPGLRMLHYEEGWLAEGRHEALVVAQAPSETSPGSR